jgi:hypothetical protein
MTKRDPLYPHVPKSKMWASEKITSRVFNTALAYSSEDLPFENENWKQDMAEPSYPTTYTEYQATLVRGGKDLGHQTYYYIPSLKTGVIETPSLYSPTEAGDESLMHKFAIHELTNMDIDFIYVAGKRLFPPPW